MIEGSLVSLTLSVPLHWSLLVLTPRGMVWRLTHEHVWIANLSCIKTHLFIGHVLDSCCQCFLTCYLHCDWNWFWAASQTTIGPQKHQMQIASFPTTIGRRHEYCISVFHKVHFYLLLSHSKLTPWLMRVSKTDLSAVALGLFPEPQQDTQ